MSDIIIEAIHQSNSKAQLIFATHVPALLTESIFEKYQIYFSEKNEQHAIQLYSLVDFKDLEPGSNIEAKYLTGNFGAIPYFHSIKLSSNKKFPMDSVKFLSYTQTESN